MDEGNNATKNPLYLRRRLFGIAILLKTLLPIFIIAALFSALLGFFFAINESVNKSLMQIDTRLSEASEQLVLLQIEGKRLYQEVHKIKKEGEKLSDSVNRAIMPVRNSVRGAWRSLRDLSNSIESAINSIIRAVNNLLPKKLKLTILNLPDIKIPELQLPKINFDIDLEVDLASITALQQTAMSLQSDLSNTAEELAGALSFWINMILIAMSLIGLWFFLVMASFLMKIQGRLRAGMMLLRGQSVENAIHFF